MTSDRNKSEKSLTIEGTLDAVKIGAGETYLSAFGIFLGGAPLQIGAISTLPPLIGAISQIGGMRFAETTASRRTLITWLIRAQALVWVLIALVPFVVGQGSLAVQVLLALVALYHITIGMLSPVWNSLVGDIISPTTRGAFFGARNRCIAVVSFVSVLVAGSLVDACSARYVEQYGFALVFLIAAVARLSSAQALCRVSDPTLIVPEESKFTFWQFVRRTRHSNFVRFVLFVSCMNFAVAVSGPYFAMYLLKDLHLSYIEYTGVVCTSVVAQLLVMRSWGVVSDQIGNRRILSLCGWFVACNPFLWLLSSNYLWILGVQFYSGFFWSGFNLAAANFVFDAVTPQKRARCIAYQGVINGVLVFAGALLGGFVCTYILPELRVTSRFLAPESSFIGLFFVSGVLRLLVVALLLKTFREVRQVSGIAGHHLLIRVIAIRPFLGASYSFVSGTYSIVANRAQQTIRGRRNRKIHPSED